MLKTELMAAVNYLSRNKLAASLKAIGLSIGIACLLLVILLIQFEFSVDRFHHNIDNIYRLLIVGESRSDDHTLKYYSDIVQSRALFLKSLPEVKDILRMVPKPGRIKFKNTWIRENRFWLTDPNVFNIFTMPLRYGDPETVLETPHSVVLTPVMASKYFGEDDPIGKTIRMQFSIIPVEYTFKVTGILEPLPKNSSIQIDFLAHIPFERFSHDRREISGNISEWVHALTFIELVDPAFYPDFQEKLGEIRCHDVDKSASLDNLKYQLEPLKRTYLHSKADFLAPSSIDAAQKKGNVEFLVILMVLGLIVLVVSCVNTINFNPPLVNLPSKRVDVEINLHTIRTQLIVRHIIENVLMCCLAILLSIVLLELLLPFVKDSFNRDIVVSYADNWIFWFCLFVVAIFVVLLSSAFPVLVISSLKLETISKKPILKSYQLLRSGLIISQLVLCLTILILSLVIFDQLNVIRTKDAGFNTKNLIFFQVDDKNLVEHYPAFKKEVLDIYGVEQMTASNFVPWSHGAMFKLAYYDHDAIVIANTMFVDPSFLETYQIEIVDGDGFSTKWTEMPGYLVINETARKVLQSTGTDPLFKSVGIPVVGGSPIGSSSFWQNRVQGVIRDFFILHPLNSIQPLAIIPSYHLRYMRSYITIRLADHNQANILSKIEEVVERYFPQILLDIRYIDSEMAKMHHKIMAGYLKAIICIVSFVVFITLVGLIGYSFYETDRCAKEIGIRKTLGAKPIQIATQLIFRFCKLTLIANVIAWPICYYIVQWGQGVIDYPYPVQICVTHFIWIGLLSLLLTIIVVLVQTYHAALIDPARALRYE